MNGMRDCENLARRTQAGKEALDLVRALVGDVDLLGAEKASYTWDLEHLYLHGKKILAVADWREKEADVERA